MVCSIVWCIEKFVEARPQLQVAARYKTSYPTYPSNIQPVQGVLPTNFSRLDALPVMPKPLPAKLLTTRNKKASLSSGSLLALHPRPQPLHALWQRDIGASISHVTILQCQQGQHFTHVGALQNKQWPCHCRCGGGVVTVSPEASPAGANSLRNMHRAYVRETELKHVHANRVRKVPLAEAVHPAYCEAYQRQAWYRFVTKPK